MKNNVRQHLWSGELGLKVQQRLRVPEKMPRSSGPGICVQGVCRTISTPKPKPDSDQGYKWEKLEGKAEV